MAERCFCGAAWQRHYRWGELVARCHRGHDPCDSLRVRPIVKVSLGDVPAMPNIPDAR